MMRHQQMPTLQLEDITQAVVNECQTLYAEKYGKHALKIVGVAPSFDPIVKTKADDNTMNNNSSNNNDEEADKEVDLTTTPASAQVDNLFASKIGGYPYIPPEELLGKDKTHYAGEVMVLQVNCSDIDHPLYPKVGLLQFWLDGKNKGNRIKYYPTFDQTVTLEQIAVVIDLQDDADGINPIIKSKCQFIKFSPTITAQYWSDGDDEMEKRFLDELKLFYQNNPASRPTGEDADEDDEDEDNEQDEDDEQEKASKGDADGDWSVEKIEFDFEFEELRDELWFDRPDSNLGGHYGWIQWDPLESEEGCNGVKQDTAVAALYLDSSAVGGKGRFKGQIDCLQWGDCGTGLWVMNEEDMRNGEWGKYYFSWDC